MEILLEEFYKTDLIVERFHERKLQLDENSYQINGITNSGKTKLAKNYLLRLRKSSYLYIDCADIRIDIQKLNATLSQFCFKNKITTLVLDNYSPAIEFVNVSQLIIISEEEYNTDILTPLRLYPLDYEEFLAFEHKYDSSALNHFVQLGGFPVMHKIKTDERNIYIQKMLRLALSDIEFDILVLCAKFISQKLSAYNIFERLKSQRKISKDKLYASFESLTQKAYVHQLAKFEYPRAIKKVYLCDTELKSALSVEKNFARLFENMVFLELLKSSKECFYEEGVDFYLPDESGIILCKPFVDERRLFKKLEALEPFIFTHGIKQITVVSMTTESSISHPIAKVDIIPFDIWALGD